MIVSKKENKTLILGAEEERERDAEIVSNSDEPVGLGF